MEISSNRRKYYLKAHIVLVTKYRKSILDGNLNIDLLHYIKSLGGDYIIENINADINHIHILVSYKPQLSISTIVRDIKQKSTNFIWKLYKSYLSLHFYKKKRMFWSDGYYISSIGLNNENIINNYINNQS